MEKRNQVASGYHMVIQPAVVAQDEEGELTYKQDSAITVSRPTVLC